MKLEIQWPLVLFSLLAGSGAALFAFAVLPVALGDAALDATFAAVVTAMVIVVVGGCCSVFHLAQWQNSVSVITNIFSFSGISRELMLLAASFVIMLVEAWLVAGAGSDVGGALQVVAVVGIVASLLLAFFCGHGYVMPGRPQWDTNLLPFAYAGTALATGGFLFNVIQIVLGSSVEAVSSLSVWNFAAALVCAVSCAAYGAHAFKTVGKMGNRGILVGGLFVCGIAVSLVCGAALLLVSAQAVVWAASFIGFVGSLAAGLAVRVVMWQVGYCYLPLFDMSELGTTV